MSFRPTLASLPSTFCKASDVIPRARRRVQKQILPLATFKAKAQDSFARAKGRQNRFLIAGWQTIRPVCHRRFLHETNTFSSRNCCLDLADGCAAQGGNLLRSEGCAHAPIFVASSQIDVKQLVSQTIFLAVLLAVVVNLQPRRK